MKKLRIKCTVWQNKHNKQKLITIPSKCNIQPGETVWIETNGN